jgi:hypothetical protein
MDAMPTVVEEFPIADFVGKSATHAGPGDDGGVIAEFLGPFDAGIGHGFARSDNRKLGEAIHEAGSFAGKVSFGVVTNDGGAVLETDLIHAHLGNGPDILWYRSDSGLTAHQ